MHNKSQLEQNRGLERQNIQTFSDLDSLRNVSAMYIMRKSKCLDACKSVVGDSLKYHNRGTLTHFCLREYT